MNSSPEPKFGLIGHPIAHSASPAVFAKAYGGRFRYDLIEGEDFQQSWQKFIDGYQAINVTAPFKETAYNKVLELEKEGKAVISDECRKIGATNLLVKTPNGIEAYNSDYRGVKALLEEKGFGKGSCAVVAGYGGAGKAAAAAAEDLGMDIVVCIRDTSKCPGSRPLDEIAILASVCDLLIYTLPVAIPQLHDISDRGFGCRLCNPVILEANYKDPCLEGTTRRYISGREWHLAQARTGYELMTGEKPVL